MDFTLASVNLLPNLQSTQTTVLGLLVDFGHDSLGSHAGGLGGDAPDDIAVAGNYHGLAAAILWSNSARNSGGWT